MADKMKLGVLAAVLAAQSINMPYAIVGNTGGQKQSRGRLTAKDLEHEYALILSKQSRLSKRERDALVRRYEALVNNQQAWAGNECDKTKAKS